MTTLDTIQQALKAMKPEISRRFFVSSIGLFGSVVRKDFSANSDIDIIVDFNKPVGIEFIDLANFMEQKLNRKVDLVSKNGIQPKYFQQIQPEIIYV